VIQDLWQKAEDRWIWFYVVMALYLGGLRSLDISTASYWFFGLAGLFVWVLLYRTIQIILVFGKLLAQMGEGENSRGTS
jgi:hypothetical protein